MKKILVIDDDSAVRESFSLALADLPYEVTLAASGEEGLEHPESAERDEILLTPTIMRVLPPPVRKLVGDLDDTERVLAGLALVAGP